MKIPLNLASVEKIAARFELYRRAATLPSVLLLLLFAAPGNAAFAQTQTPAKPAPTSTPASAQKSGVNPGVPTTTGTIKGRLVADDGQPLTNANVLVQAITGEPTAKPTRVDSEGRFAFDDLPAALYIIIATAPGYIDSSVSQGDPSQWPRHLIGDQVRVTMIKGGVITGSIINSKGDPIVGIPVHATLTQGPTSSLLNFLSGGGVSESDDRGIYRIFGLLPGQYTVTAGGSGQFGQFGASGFDLDIPTYYPSSTRDTAVPVAVRSGEETTGIDIKHRGTEGHSISGVVLGAIEASASQGAVTILLTHAGTTSVLSFALASVADPRRAFGFNGVADGEYDVFASFLASANDNAVVGTRRVTVRGGDVTGLELRLVPLASIAGTLALDPIKPEDKCDKRGSQLIETRLNAPRDDPKKSGSQAMTALFTGFGGTLNAKSEFAMRNLEAGRYRFDTKLPTESWYVRAITLPGAAQRTSQPSGHSSTAPASSAAAATQGSPWQGVVTIRSGEQVSGVSIMIAQDAASLRGRVGTSSEKASIPPGLRVHLVTADPQLANNVLCYSETFVASDGTFEFTNIAPGRYFVVSRLEPPAEPDVAPRPIAWDPIARAKLRRDAETTNAIVELKPCQRMVDYELKPRAPQ